MADEMSMVEWDNWLATRPKSIQWLAAEFPYGTPLPTCSGPVYVVGWTENDGLMVSKADPYEDFDESRENSFAVPACHARRNKVGSLQ